MLVVILMNVCTKIHGNPYINLVVEIFQSGGPMDRQRAIQSINEYLNTVEACDFSSSILHSTQSVYVVVKHMIHQKVAACPK